MASTASQRAMQARIAAHESWAGVLTTDERRARTRPGHTRSPVSVEYWRDRFAEEHPHLDERERLAAADNAHKAYMTRLSLKASQARAARKNGNR